MYTQMYHAQIKIMFQIFFVSKYFWVLEAVIFGTLLPEHPVWYQWKYLFTCVLPDSTIFFQIGAMEPPISLMDTTSGGLLVFCSPSFTFWMLTMFEPDVMIMSNVISERPLTSCGHAGGMFTNGPRTAVCCQWLYEQSFTTSRSSLIFKM